MKRTTPKLLVPALLSATSLSCSGGSTVTPVETSMSEAGGTDESVSPDQAQGECAWLHKKTAVSLTYDDAMPSQLSTAIPALNAHGFRGTFFITDVRSNLAPWSALLNDGHELAAHTFNHPCPASNSWVPEGKANEDYDLERMTSELDEQIQMLGDLGARAPYTFAYPCGETYVGEDQTSYIPLIEERFIASRGVVGATAGKERSAVRLAAVPGSSRPSVPRADAPFVPSPPETAF